MIESLIYGIAWAGIVMLYDFSMWENGILDFWYEFLKTLPVWLGNSLGTCCVCFGFWFGLLDIFSDDKYFIFLGTSELILIFYYLYKRQQTLTND